MIITKDNKNITWAIVWNNDITKKQLVILKEIFEDSAHKCRAISENDIGSFLLNSDIYYNEYPFSEYEIVYNYNNLDNEEFISLYTKFLKDSIIIHFDLLMQDIIYKELDLDLDIVETEIEKIKDLKNNYIKLKYNNLVNNKIRGK